MRFRPLHVLLLALVSAPAVSAQTAADSAEAVLRAARVLEQSGRADLARELLRHLRQQWPGTPAAEQARERIAALPAEALSGFGRTSFVAYHTLFGAWLGVAIPRALDADGPEPYGVGLLVGAPLGFIGSRALARSRQLSQGQAGVIEFGSFWGGWQAIGWRAVLDIGERRVCDIDLCFDETPGTAPWVAAIVGSLSGLGVGLLAGSRPVADGTSSLVFHASLWGTWYGVAAGVLFDAEDDDLLTAALIGGNAGLLLALPAARAWRPTSNRVRVASAAGLAGGLAGLGVALLTSVDDEKALVGLISAGTTAGLLAGAALGKDDATRLGSATGSLFAPALVSGDGQLRLGLPLPTPARIGISTPRGPATVTTLRIPLLNTTF